MPSRRKGSLRKTLSQQDKRLRQLLLQACINTGTIFKRTQETVVQSWKIDVGFKTQAVVIPNLIEVSILATGQDAAIYFYIDRGTGTYGPKGQPYVILPKGDYPLRFQTGYAPRTSPIGKFGGPGQAFGPWVSKHSVIHPGIKAREFSKSTAQNIRRIYINNLKDAIKRVN